MVLLLSDRLIHFEERIHYFDEMANKISSAQCSEDMLIQTKLEFEHDNHELMTWFESEVQDLATILIEPFQSAMISQVQSLMTHFEYSGEKLAHSYAVSENNHVLDALFIKYQIICNSQDRSDLSCLDELKERNLQIVLSQALTPTQLKETIKFHNTIQRHQEVAINKMLRELHTLIVKALHCHEDDQTQVIQSIAKIWDEDLDCCELGRNVQYLISQQFEIEEGDSEESLEVTVTPSLLQKCDAIITSHPLYKNKDVFEIVKAIDSSSEEEGGSIEDHPEIEDPQAWKEAFDEEKKPELIGELDLQTLSSQVLKVINNSDWSKEERTALINQARYRLPEKVRWSLDGTVYELSKDSQKGGENWGDKHAADDPILLLNAIHAEINKKLISI
ncbi:MAG TPA: hypothetical protein VLG49_01495 [Rhabdochlamydiaceae bacterium]|nr:hypothetical protein [Rhabdochlamydiaceae bacterium]